MSRYLVLLRGINVGGRNKVPMAALRELLESHGHTNVSTYIASGNVILSSDRSAGAIKREIEAELPKAFRLDSDLIAALVLSRAERLPLSLRQTVEYSTRIAQSKSPGVPRAISR